MYSSRLTAVVLLTTLGEGESLPVLCVVLLVSHGRERSGGDSTSRGMFAH